MDVVLIRSYLLVICIKQLSNMSARKSVGDRDVKNNSDENAEAKSSKNVTTMKEFQECIDICTFGKYQYGLVAVTFIHSISNCVANTNFAYVLPNAECDLKMSIYEKGILNAVPYVGMLCSGFFVGFLTDTFGRKTVLLVCLYGMFISICVQGTSQTFGVLAASKAVEGCLFNGSSCASIALLSEFMTSKTRDRVMLTSLSFTAIGQIVLALLAWGILPNDWDFQLFGGALTFHSWNYFLYVGGIFSLVAAILFSQFPESPKYHFAHGRFEEAFDTLKKIYSMNTGRSPETFPYQAIYEVSTENEVEKKSFIKAMRESLHSLKPMFRKPLFTYLLTIGCVQCVLMVGYNVMRLWYPQISTIVENHKPTGNTTNLCIMLDTYVSTKNNKISTIGEGIQECIPNKSGTQTYINSIVMGLASCIPYPISGILIKFVAKRILVIAILIMCVCMCVGLTWTTNSIQVAALFSTFVALAQVCLSILQTISLELFPTISRTFAVSLILMIGRLATLIGNVVFPILLAQGCVVPFISIASIVGCAALLAFLLPNSKL